LFYFYFY